MTANRPGTFPGLPLASFFDAQGHRVTAEVTRSDLLALRSWTPGGKLSDGFALNDQNAVELRDALNEFIGRGKP